MSSFDRQTVQKVWRHTAPPLIAALFLSYLDRVNLGFAALTLNRDLGLSNSQFGSAAGAFALGYVLFGIPGTLLVERFGARR